MSDAPLPAIWWVRRDFRLADNPALRRAIEEGQPVVPLFVLDPALLSSAGRGRGGWVRAALHALDAHLRAGGGPGLSVFRGRPADVVPQVAAASDVARVHIAADFGPYGRRRDAAVAAALARDGRELVTTGSPYAVAPGSIAKDSGEPYQVFSPFHRAWVVHGVHEPAGAIDAGQVDWLAAPGREELPDADRELVAQAGEGPAQRHWADWVSRDPKGVQDYVSLHNDLGADATSRISVALRWGHLHPRTVLNDLSRFPSKGAEGFSREIAWRDFFADVLWHRPDAVTKPVKPEYSAMEADEVGAGSTAEARLQAWRAGRTGFPLVDAGMRQLVNEGWMHNRVRMVTASFLIKDLHLWWTHGADFFMEHLRDGDISQNQLNWQWVAGCGTDAAPFFRVFNPTGQAEKFDPDGIYIRRHVPELRDVPLEHLHAPWLAPDGPPPGYPQPIVDHPAERKEALRRYEAIRG